MKRYDKYKDSGISWIGDIPEHWEVRRLKFLISFINGYAFNSNDFVREGEMPVIRIGDIVDGKISYDDIVMIDKDVSLYKYAILENDILMAMSGATTGKIGLARSTDCGYINQRVGIIRTRAYKYIYNVLSTPMFMEYVSLSAGGAAQPNISAHLIQEYAIPLPPLSEQEAIVAYLEGKVSLIDELVKKQEAQIALLRELKQSIISKAVTQGTDKDVALRPSGIPWIGEIPEHWEVKKLRSFVTLFSEKGHSDKTLLSVTRDNGVIVRDIESKDENHNFIPTDLSGYKLIHSGDFVINKMKAWQGAYAVSEYQGIVSPAYYTCKLSFPNKEFFNIAIRSKAYIPFFTQYSKGIRVDQWDLSPNSLKEIPFFLPPLPEQEAIVSYISRKTSEIDKLIAKQEAQITQLRELKQTLIADAVTGRINVQPS